MSGAVIRESEYQHFYDRVSAALDAGRTRDEIIEGLVEDGYPFGAAIEFVEYVVKATGRDPGAVVEDEEDEFPGHARRMLHGALWLAGGVAVALAAWKTAAPAGAYALVAALVAGGLAELCSGLVAAARS